MNCEKNKNEFSNIVEICRGLKKERVYVIVAENSCVSIAPINEIFKKFGATKFVKHITRSQYVNDEIYVV